MANAQIGNIRGLTAKGGKNRNGGDDSGAGHFDTDYATITALRARLTTAGYTSQRLDTMTENDMVYAVRLLDSAGTVK